MGAAIVSIGGIDHEGLIRTRTRARQLRNMKRDDLERLAAPLVVQSEMPDLSKDDLIFLIMDAEDDDGTRYPYM